MSKTLRSGRRLASQEGDSTYNGAMVFDEKQNDVALEELEEKLRQMEVEREELEEVKKRGLKGTISKASKSKKDRKSENVGMDEMQREVDHFLDQKMKCKIKSKSMKSEKKRKGKSSHSSKHYLPDSSSSAESSSDSSFLETSDSSSESSEEEVKRSSRRKRKDKKSRKKRSGKDSKMTSYVKYPQEWPHAHLSLHFVNKSRKYDDLTIQEFCAGYCSILDEVDGKELKYRVQHLRELMYLSTIYRWECVLSYHAACLLEIERGHFRWGDSFQTLQMTTLAGGVLQKPDHANRTNESGPVFFCKNYQRGICEETSDHIGDYNGTSRFLRHICAICWLQSRKKAPHSEMECSARTD